MLTAPYDRGAEHSRDRPCPTQAAIALGSNLGHSAQILLQALAVLDAEPDLQVLARSSLYQTRPVGPPQPDYLNACAVLETNQGPLDLLQTLLRVEQQFGRVRRERWGPRLLDLDLLLYGDRILSLPQLEIPHPRMVDRAFVLVPLAEIAPHWREPRSGRTIADLTQQLDCSGVVPHHLALF
ncbi:MAG: 2-amino-4-hydroxy-6-hydroxymethyldihydropteridine diphosphokinase [Prochlorothrix sp.]